MSEGAGRAALGVMYLLLVGAPMLFGGAFAWSIAIIAWVSFLGFALALAAARGEGASIGASALFFTAHGALAFTVLQCVPFPSAWVDSLAPRALEEATRTASALGHSPPTWLALSRDPGATMDEIIKGIGIVSAFGIGWIVAGMGSRAMVLRAAAISTAAMALVGLGHELLALDAVWGLYTPLETSSHVLAPLINGNMLAGFMALGAPLLVGLGLEAGEARGAWLAWSGALLCVVVASLTLSRAGVAMTWGGTALMVGFGIPLRRKASTSHAGESPMRLEAPAIIAGALLALVASLAIGPFVDELEAGDLSKLELGMLALSEVEEAPLVGVGRGAFGVAFVEALGTDEFFSHPENIVAQWVSEWGVVVGGLTLLVALSSLLLAFRHAREPSVLGACVGLAAIGAQNLVDYGLEMLGVAVVAAALFGAVARRPEDEQQRGSPGRGTRAGLAALPLFLLGLLWTTPGVEARDPRLRTARLHRMAVAGDRDAFRAKLEEALALHPGDPSLALVAAAEATGANDPGAARWLNLAMRRAPGWPTTHRLAAVWLMQRGAATQAALELRAAEARLGASTGTMVCGFLARPDGLELIVLAVPRASPESTLVLRASRCEAMTPERLARLDELALELDSPPLDVFVRGIDRALSEERFDESDALFEQGVVIHPDAPSLRRAEIRILGGRGDRGAQLARLDELLATAIDRRPLLEERARIHADAVDESGLSAALEELRGLAGGRGSELSRVAILEGDMRVRMGQPSHAIRAYEQAFNLDPGTIPLRKMVRVAERAGQVDRARMTYRRICQLDPDDQRACERAHPRRPNRRE